MPADETSALIVVLIAAISLVGIALAASSFATHESFGGIMGGGSGGMMNSTGTRPTANMGPGALEWAVLILSTAFLASAVVLFFRGRSIGPAPPSAPSSASAPVASAPIPVPSPTAIAPATSGAAVEPVPEPALIKLLGVDERTMYLEIRDQGGTMLQRDLVSLGIFSKAKVTRVLDKLEAKGIVVREAHGMTNRVRIVNASR